METGWNSCACVSVDRLDSHCGDRYEISPPPIFIKTKEKISFFFACCREIALLIERKKRDRKKKKAANKDRTVIQMDRQTNGQDYSEPSTICRC